MYTSTSGITLPTTITGSLPRPSWYTENLGIKSFLDAMVVSRLGMSRRHALYKMVALVQGTNLVRRELGVPVAESRAADPRLSLIRT